MLHLHCCVVLSWWVDWSALGAGRSPSRPVGRSSGWPADRFGGRPVDLPTLLGRSTLFLSFIRARFYSNQFVIVLYHYLYIIMRSGGLTGRPRGRSLTCMGKLVPKILLYNLCFLFEVSFPFRLLFVSYNFV